MTAAVEVNNVSKSFRLFQEKNSTLKATLMRGRRSRYEDFLALDDVSFQVPEGKTFALVGENGSGKSTLLKCLAKILHPDKGTVATHGKVSALLELGAGFHAELSGRENIYLNGSILGLSRRDIDQRFDDIVEFAGGDVPRFIDNPVKNYSSGMFIRLGFAIAINVQPDILLVDEILAVGDEDFQRKCMTKFAEFRKAGRTVVVVSHALDVVRNLCDDAAWFEHGRVRQLGSAGKVVDSYLESVATGRSTGDAEIVTRDMTAGGPLRAVQLLGPDAQPTTTIRTGEPARLRVEVECGTTGETEVLRLDIEASDGTLATRATSRDTDVVVDELTGVWSIDYTMDRVLLAPREYSLSVALMQQDGITEWERVPEALTFEVVPGDIPHRGGYMLAGGDWSVAGPAPPPGTPDA